MNLNATDNVEDIDISKYRYACYGAAFRLSFLFRRID
jgi:hypothetical protein